MAYKNILSQMFDVRPVSRKGNLDMEKIARIREVLDLAEDDRDLLIKVLREFQEKRKRRSFFRKNLKKGVGVYRKKIGKNNPESFSFADVPAEYFLRNLPQDDGIVFKALKTDSIGETLDLGEILAQMDEVELGDAELKEKLLAGLEKAAPPEKETAEKFREKTVSGAMAKDAPKKSPAFVPMSEIIPVAAKRKKEKKLKLFVTDRGGGEAVIPIKIIKAPHEKIAPVSPKITAKAFRPKEKEAPVEEFSLESELKKISVSEIEIPQPPQKAVYAEKKQTVKDAGRESSIRGRCFGLRPQKDRKYFVAAKAFNFKRSAFAFSGACAMIFLIIFGLSLTGQGLVAKSNIFSSGLEAYRAMIEGKESAARLDFSAAQVSFETAYQNFLNADKELNKMGGVLISLLETLPGAGSKISSGEALIEAGKNLAQAGQSFSRIGAALEFKKMGDYFSGAGESLTQKLAQARDDLQAAQSALVSANQNFSRINSADLPGEFSTSFENLKNQLPLVAGALTQFNDWSDAFLSIFGHQKARKYLLIFQNPAEARPTGGFIGTYGVVSFDEGLMKNLFIDGVFNLDGQLNEKVIPPKPIQKISTAWSMHDANWFADFPASSRKIMDFYEAAESGSTVDGVVSLTPAVVEKLLVLTGPIDLPEYNVSLDQSNFSELIQYKVEADYDKELNQPKKILADFAPKFLDKLWSVWPQNYEEIFRVLMDSLAQKDILFYFSDPALEKKILDQGWGGEIMETGRDYLNVINTNINGFKTDKVIEQKIYQETQIFEDGSVVNSIKITRTHNGGQAAQAWYNGVNADYLRVYVPEGSKLLSAKGHTRETVKAPADYEKLYFKNDPDILAQEQSTQIDENSGTQIFSESGKTVFGNWTYVSPGETVEVVYDYLLPFKIDLSAPNFSWSLLAQRQAGGLPSGFESTLILPAEYEINWQYPEDLEISGNKIKFKTDLITDKFYGVVLGN